MNRGVSYSAFLRGTAYRHCFISFPHHWRAFISPATVPSFVIESGSHSVVVSWAGHTHDQDSHDEIFVCLNSKLIQVNGFSDGEAVIVRQISCPSPCTCASMTVLSDSDWEELTLNMEVAQNAFLTQLRVIKTNQIFPLWLEGGLFIYLKVDSCIPSTTVSLLQQNTQVNVLPSSYNFADVSPVALRSSSGGKDSVRYNIKHEQNISRMIYTIFNLFGYGYKKFEILPKQDVFISLKAIHYSLSTSRHQNLLNKLLKSHPSIVIVSGRNLKRTKFEYDSYFIGKISKYNISSDKNSSNTNPPLETSSKIFAVILIWEKLKPLLVSERICIDDFECILKHQTCIIGHSLSKKLLIDKTGIVIIDTSDIPLGSKSFHIDIETVNSRKDLVVSSVIAAISDINTHYPIVFNDKVLLSINLKEKPENVLLSTRDGNPIVVEKGCVSKLSFYVDNVSAKQIANKNSVSVEKIDSKDELTKKVIVNKEVFTELLSVIKKDLHLKVRDYRISPQFILLQGNKSSGKTTIIKNLVAKLSEAPYFVHCQVISLKILKGKKVESVQKLLKPAISEALNLRPSLIVLDDLDFLTNMSSVEEKGAAYEYANHMAFMIKNLLSQLLDILKSASRNVSNDWAEAVTVVATCLSRNYVHSLLSSPKGNHIFPKSISIGALSEESKFLFFRHVLENMFNIFLKIHKKLRWIENVDNIFNFKNEEIIPKLDGLTLCDIKNLSVRVFLEAKKRWLKDSRFIEDGYDDYPLGYTSADIIMAYDGFISSAMKELNIQPVVKKASKIGGLHQARQTLEEMILWPSKYPHLFSQTSLKLRSGILLYGPPGCGKTLLAKSYENYPHLNFITIQGPELLSKYIGQSEKAVRDAFERAESAKPCVLFFDEFESIAPRRGHDNTGVTDRVVNQLLTQMDGVEGISGVYVLGATSRPELIDPALLRPGRLDKGVYCPLPDENDREEILNILCEDLNLEDLVNIRDMVQRTEGYSGADLQSVISTALVKAAQIYIGSSLYEEIFENSKDDSVPNELEQAPDLLETKYDVDDSVHINKIFENTDHLSLCITLEHICAALAEVQPSVEEKERQRYEILHKQFSSSKESKYFTKVKPGKKETLA